MIVPFIILRNVLEFVRPIAAKLQKRDGDIVEAYNMIDKTIDRMKHVREQIESEYDDWFQTAEELALSVDTVITKPRLLGFQRNRANAPAADAREYYRLNVAVPFLDHVIQEMDSRFPKSDRVGLALLQLLPPAVTSVDLEKLRNDLLFWEIDLPAPCSLKMELREWRNFWSREGGAVEHNISNLIKSTDEDVFPNIKSLLRIGGTLPCTSVEAERSFSALRRTMTYTRSTMTDERLAGLLLISVHRAMNINREEVSERFVLKNRRKMFLNCLLYDEN
ncbi:52 kDa repressor of the inhibitor of the protein kinase-like [Dermacentor silvarum]|uniref:52 kDa repressor of the inhibitor of the protein kinase-like n=1 Tax=Dermacentor silvarum TaxID=543639 RepID=UPI002100811B|nr:52 kDa repressor of the inhibitor of the protein kinase-like [Dermacentor silvarum]